MKHEFLKEIVETYSPSGYEDELQLKLYNHYKEWCNTFKTDNRGTLTAIYNETSDFKVMLIAHADEISLVVNGYNSDGSLRVDKNGGIRTKLYVGQRVVVISGNNKYYGIMGTNSSMQKASDLGVDALFVDCGFNNSEDAKNHIKLGAYVVHTAGYQKMQNDLVCARAFDDRLGDYIIHEAALKAYQKGCSSQIMVTTSTGEENTGRGAYSSASILKPDVAIVVDVTFSNDYKGADNENDVILGKGGVICEGSVPNRKLNQMLKECALELNLPVQYEVWQGRTGTDGDTILKTNEDPAIVLFSIPLRYMHSPVEVASLKDIESMIDILALLLQKLNKDTNLKPFELN